MNQSSISQPSKSARVARVCGDCGSDAITRSRLQNFDGLRAGIFGKQPYRCLRCYNRTWLVPSTARDRKAGLTVFIVLLALVVMALSFYQFFSNDEPIASVSIIVPDAVPTDVVDEQVESPSLASLINMPEQANSSASANNESSALVYDSRRVDDLKLDKLSPEQQAALLLQVKQQAKTAEQVSQARVEQLDQALLPEDDELESLVKIEIGYVIERWRGAWSKGDVETYLQSYSSSFTPASRVELTQWKAARRLRVTPEKQIQLELSEFSISMQNELNGSVVEFNQRYQSASYRESSRKRLALQKEGGSWKIISEVELK